MIDIIAGRCGDNIAADSLFNFDYNWRPLEPLGYQDDHCKQ